MTAALLFIHFLQSSPKILTGIGEEPDFDFSPDFSLKSSWRYRQAY